MAHWMLMAIALLCALWLVTAYTHTKQKYITASNDNVQSNKAHGERNKPPIPAQKKPRIFMAFKGLGSITLLAIYIVFLGMYLLDSSHSLYIDT